MRVLIFVIVLCGTAARADYNSAARGEMENFADARARLEAEALRAGREPNAARVPMTAATYLTSLDYRYSPQYVDVAQVMKAFEAARDHLYFPQMNFPGYFRRLTWTYPDDGCYARAELTAQEISVFGFPKPAKVFAIGSLTVATPNHPRGHVEWVYHVAPIVNVGVQAFVIDPALEPTRPLSVFEWFGRMRGPGPGDMRAVICQGATYGPFDDCDAPTLLTFERVTRDMMPYLPREWLRQLEMLRNPAAMLLGLL